MVDKTTEQISRTCFAWRPTHDLPSTREAVVWFEILQSDDGTRKLTTLNVVHEIRPKSKRGKTFKTYILNQFVGKALMPIQDLGISSLGVSLDPIVITTPPTWLDALFENLATQLEAMNKVPIHLTAANMAAVAQAAYMETITPKAPPTPPPMLGLTWGNKRV